MSDSMPPHQEAAKPEKGILYLVPAPLSEDGQAWLPTPTVEIAQRLKIWAVERTRTARRLLKVLGTIHPLDSLQFTELNEHTKREEINAMLDAAFLGEDMGLMSESGCPGVADPGAELVALAHKRGITVYPLSGPSSILLALMASGMNGQTFAFQGYLPVERSARSRALRELEATAKRRGQTQIFIETPYRNDAMFQEALQSLEGDTRLGFACDLTSPTQEIKVMTVSAWRALPALPELHKRPTVFLLY